MKKSLFTLSLALSTICLSAQNNAYHHFPDSNAVWNFSLKESCVLKGSIDEEYSILIDGDTLINSIKYNKLYTPYVKYDTIGCGNSSKIESPGYKGALREDSLNKKVYYIPPSSSTEELLYDFTLKIGDSLKGYLFSNPNFPHTAPIQAIDSVVIGNNYHKRWVIDSSCIFPIYIIEGIGSSFGLITQIPDCGIYDGAYYGLSCFKHNQQVFNANGSCEVITTTKHAKKLSGELSLYPNPTSGSLRLENVENLQSISVYNIQGQKVQEINPSKRKWDLPQKSGLYLIRLQDDNGNYYTEKVIKQ